MVRIAAATRRNGEVELIREVRSMTGQDIEQVADLEQVCLSESWPENLVRMGLNSKLDTYFAYAGHGAILGYAVVRTLVDKGEIQRIGIYPNYRRQGVAREPMDAMVAFARVRGVRAIALEVWESNLGVRKLYDPYGFRQEAARKGHHYNPAGDIVIMWDRTI